MSRSRSTAGVTLIEVLIAVTLLSLLTLGMLLVMRTGLMAYSKTNDRLMENRRVTGAQRVLQDELEGLIPATPPCTGQPSLANLHFNFFQAEPQRMRMISAFSLQEGSRGHPQVLEFLVIPGKDGQGLRLVVNEIPYSPMVAGKFCTAIAPDPELGISVPVFPAVAAGPDSFILADKLSVCRFSYLTGDGTAASPVMWRATATGRGWPQAIRIEMAPIEPDPGRLQPITVTAPLYLHRSVDMKYEDK
ncbi:MAG TPA: prepilin-type N-terminal cleavage/methylation domain-containing protein [Verrucomicrobiae bacterium]|nr:prepilin-type N-terminal cleavage/methylation domain-containing protein [Verrucomicrobiae bacterium]